MRCSEVTSAGIAGSQTPRRWVAERKAVPRVAEKVSSRQGLRTVH